MLLFFSGAKKNVEGLCFDNADRCRPPLCSGKQDKTFKPKKNIAEGSPLYNLHKEAQATLGAGNLRLAVALPRGEDLNEWVAVNSA